MAKDKKVENKDQAVEKSTKKSVKSSYSKKKKTKKRGGLLAPSSVHSNSYKSKHTRLS